ncbi:hypothetical protein [Dyadobacter pollutisoli]|uniref:Uncharacterized protein n=1 Tax=Dyadobacter pollutisoli TaxID=2910158 RepID=A0A9E8N932_9BACT|nr:hypothetical protein [Dyadobacter pollutisoli]WAC12229.1 hypothetical protein ON006_31455 [Dyadobacter pollutisoli]
MHSRKATSKNEMEVQRNISRLKMNETSIQEKRIGILTIMVFFMGTETMISLK